MPVTFAVDDVEEDLQLLPAKPLRARFEGALHVAGDAELSTVDVQLEGDLWDGHPLYLAALLAYAKHKHLVLGPDAVWLTIAHGISTHVRANADALRPRLVRHADRKVLRVELRERPTTAESWTSALSAMSRAVSQDAESEWAKASGRDVGGFFRCDFSTSSPFDRLASEIVLLETFSRYYSYLNTAPCGIPRITLEGTPADWREIRQRVEALPALGLESWAASLRVILDAFIETAEGRIDQQFWREMIRAGGARCGTQYFGWLGRLYAYVGRRGEERPNEMLELTHQELLQRLALEGEDAGLPSMLPAAAELSHVEVEVDLVVERFMVNAVGGLGAIEQDAAGRLVPRSVVAILPPAEEQRETAIWARIVREQEVLPYDEDEERASRSEFFDRYREAIVRAGTRSLRILPRSESLVIEFRGERERGVAVAELDDGLLLIGSRGKSYFVERAAIRLPPDQEESRARATEEHESGLATRAEYAEKLAWLEWICDAALDALPSSSLSWLDWIGAFMDHEGKVAPLDHRASADGPES